MAGAVQRGAKTPQDVRYDPMTVAALAEISASTNCFIAVIAVSCKIFVSRKKEHAYRETSKRRKIVALR
jgi:hypothetical protein